MSYPSWLVGEAIKRLNQDNDQGYTPDVVIQTLLSNLFATHSAVNKLKISEFTISGTLTCTEAEFFEKVDSLEGIQVYNEVSPRSGRLRVYVHEHFCLKVQNSSEKYGTPGDGQDKWIEIHTSSDEVLEKVVSLFKPILVRKIKKGSVFALANRGGSLQFTSMGIAGDTLVPENYTQEVQDAYNQIVTDLNSSKPSGRLSIIDGPAGTGKTHLVKALLSEVRGMFILISPETIHELANPSIVPLLISTREDHSKTGEPIIFVLEDADAALVPREGGNMGLISSLLNYTDGIFGALFDLRVIATTNAKKFQIEEALLRAGRLSVQVTVDLLPIEDANKIYRRLSKDEADVFTEPVRLADVYAKAHGFKSTKEKSGKAPKESGKVGFGAR
jgi:ATP-dependent Zn protease